MTGAWRNEDYEEYENIFNSREKRLTNLLSIEADLMEYWTFSWSDIQKLKVFERRFYIKRINEKIHREHKQSFS